MAHPPIASRNADAGVGPILDLIRTLRSERGCPWDRKQTPSSMSAYLVEETHELIEAIESDNTSDIGEELGDVLFLLLFVLVLYEEQQRLDLGTVVGHVLEKMIRRHPHVFGDRQADDPEAVRRQWDEIKKEESVGQERQSVLDGIPRGLPALMRAFQVSERAANAGFDWDDMDGVMAKVVEEWSEFKNALAAGQSPEQQREMAVEFGDVLFTLVNVARFAAFHPENALQAATRKFEARFRYMESQLDSEGQGVNSVGREVLDSRWESAKSACS